jgi:hypothetical protein
MEERSMNIGEPKIAAAVAVRELLVVQAELVQDRRVQVVDMDTVFDRVHAELIGRAVHHAALDAAAGQHHRKAGVVMVPSRLSVLGRLSVRCAAKLAAPDHQRFVKESASL